MTIGYPSGSFYIVRSETENPRRDDPAKLAAGTDALGWKQQEGNVDYARKQTACLTAATKYVTRRHDYTQEFDPVNSCTGGEDSTNAQKLTTIVHCQNAMQETVEPIDDGFTLLCRGWP